MTKIHDWQWQLDATRLGSWQIPFFVVGSTILVLCLSTFSNASTIILELSALDLLHALINKASWSFECSTTNNNNNNLFHASIRISVTLSALRCRACNDAKLDRWYTIRHGHGSERRQIDSREQRTKLWASLCSLRIQLDCERAPRTETSSRWSHFDIASEQKAEAQRSYCSYNAQDESICRKRPLAVSGVMYRWFGATQTAIVVEMPSCCEERSKSSRFLEDSLFRPKTTRPMPSPTFRLFHSFVAIASPLRFNLLCVSQST